MVVAQKEKPKMLVVEWGDLRKLPENVMTAVDNRRQDTLYKRHKNEDGSVGGFVADSAKIGSNVRIALRAVVGEGVELADGVTVEEWAEVGGGTRLGAGTVVGKHAMVAGRIGAGVKIGNGVDIFFKAVVEDGVTIGDNARIDAEETIGAGSTIGSGAVVEDDLKPGTRVPDNALIITGDGGLYIDDMGKVIEKPQSNLEKGT